MYMTKTLRFLPVIAMLLITLAAEALEVGQTVRLVNGGKSLLVENSSLDENKNVILWTETNVNSQRWTLAAGSKAGTFLLVNDYTNYYLGGLTSSMSGNVGQVSKTNANTKGAWEFVPVEGTDNQYIIYQSTTRKYALAAPATVEEGSTLTIVNTLGTTPVDAARITWTVETVAPMEKAFTKDKRDDMMEAFKKRHYKKQGTGYSIDNGGWWGDAEMFETILDALETTGDQQYATMFDNLYTNFLARNQSTWYKKGVNGYNEYNDDIAWMCIACVRAYLLTGQTKYRTTAKSNFDGMFARADCYGNDLLQWKHNSGTGTNSCINGPAAVCACYLAIATADDSYYEKARKTYMAERGVLFEMSNGKPTGKVWDSYSQGNNSYNYWASTYNQGTCLGAAIMLYNHYKDPMFKEDADAIIKWSEANMANSKGIIHVCQTVRGDLCGFKGIMLRYLRKYAEDFEAPTHYAWIAKNAYHAWNNRNSAGITSSAWLTKSEENFKHQEGSELKTFESFGNSTCLSAAFNCHLGAVDSHSAYGQNQAEDFNYVRNAQVSDSGNTDDGSGQVTTSKSNYYIGYRRVQFGDKPASHIDLRANITLASTGVNVFMDYPNATKGKLLCTIKGADLEAVKTWQTVRKALERPVTGLHDIYFVAVGAGQTNINWWQFQSLNPVYDDLTNANGKLSTSLHAAGIEALTDGDLTTAYTSEMAAGQEAWVQYQSVSPMLLKGYQFFSGETNANPKGWRLQASNDGKNWTTLHTVADTTFSVCAQRFASDITTRDAYTHFRLLFDCNETQQRLSVSEWQLLGRCITANDMTADGGTIAAGYEPLVDHVGTTTVAAPFTAAYRAGSINKLTAYSITVDEAGNAPTSWKLEGSANGTAWKAIDQRTDASFPYDGYTAIYRVNPDVSYLHYRLSVASEGEVCQWQLFGTPDFGTYYADITEIATVTSCDGSNVAPLIDNNGETYATISGDSLYWDIRTPLSVKPLGFSIVCADDAELDPENILLVAIGEDNTQTVLSSRQLTFSARHARVTYTVSTSKLFKHFALIIPNTNKTRIADFELYGAAIADDEPCYNAPATMEASAAALATTEGIEKLIDKNRTTCYHSNFYEPVTITLSYGEPVPVNTYGITASKNEPTRDPAEWTLEGSNDGKQWRVVDNRTDQAFSHRYATQFYFCENAASYSYYRLTVKATAGASQLQMGELQLLNIDQDNVTEITSPSAQTNAKSQYIYDLSGRRMKADSKLPKGIYITDGKKVLK